MQQIPPQDYWCHFLMDLALILPSATCGRRKEANNSAPFPTHLVFLVVDMLPLIINLDGKLLYLALQLAI